MKKILYCAMIFGLLSSAAFAQEKAAVEARHVDSIFVEAEAVTAEGQPRLPFVTLQEGRFIEAANVQRGRLIEAATFTFAGKCSSCHTSTAFAAGEGAVVDFVSSTSQNMTSGAALLKPDSVTRSMLKLEDQHGLVVHGVCPTAKQLHSVLEAYDIILTVNGEVADDVQKVDKALGSAKPLELIVLRDGKKKEIKRPGKSYATSSKQKRYLVGIVLGELYSVVKAQLQLDDSVSVFIKSFSEKSAGETAGLKENDILLKVDDQPIVDSGMLQKIVQNSDGKALKIEVLRDGSELEIMVVPNLVEANYFAVVEGKKGQVQRGRYTMQAPHLPDVMPQIHMVPQQAITWPHAMSRPVAGQAQSIQAQLNQIEQQLERMTTALESLGAKK